MKNLIFIFVLSCLISACGGDAGTTKINFRESGKDLSGTVAVINHTPADFEGNVPVTSEVKVIFSGPVSFSALDSFKMRIVDDTGILVPTRITPNSDRSEISIVPYYSGRRINLLKSTTYHVYLQSLTSELQDLDIPDYYFKFRTVPEVETTGRFKVDRIRPDGSTMFPTSRFEVYFTEAVEPPTSNDIPGSPNCSRTEWADAFQIASLPILGTSNAFVIDSVSGIACLDRDNPKKVSLIPDRELGVDNQGRLFSDGSVARITIRPSDSLRSAESGERLAETLVENKYVIPSISYLFNWYDSIF